MTSLGLSTDTENPVQGTSQFNDELGVDEAEKEGVNVARVNLNKSL